MPADIPKLPTEFRGCMWDDGWEFDAPCAIYLPWRYRRYGEGGNNSVLDSLVEDVCYDIGAGIPPSDGGLASECNWRGWSLRGLSRRRRAEHVVFAVEWALDETGWPWAEIVERTETLGIARTARRG